jgi:hypothetical protein
MHDHLVVPDLKFEFGRLHHRQVGRLGPFEDAAHIKGSLELR